jgi:hypothetical protein
VATVSEFAAGCTAYWGEEGLARLLAASDVDAVAIVLPVQNTLEVRQADGGAF